MANDIKPTYTKLKLVSDIPEDITIQINGIDVHVKQYLPVEKKLSFIQEVLERAVEKDNFYNPAKIEIFFNLQMLYDYTDIVFTIKQRENFIKMYDVLELNHIFDMVINSIPKEEYETMMNWCDTCAKNLYEFQVSLIGILMNLKETYGENADTIEKFLESTKDGAVPDELKDKAMTMLDAYKTVANGQE